MRKLHLHQKDNRKKKNPFMNVYPRVINLHNRKVSDGKYETKD